MILTRYSRRPKYRNNTSGAVGVTWNKNSRKWVARVFWNGQLVYSGYFTSKREAIKARKAHRIV